MCLSMFSGVKAYSPLTARELSSGEHAQRQAAHAEEPKAEVQEVQEELKANTWCWDAQHRR